MKTDLQKKLPLPSGVSVVQEGTLLRVKGKQGEVARKYYHPRVQIGVAGEAITLSVQKATKREKKVLNTFTAHLKNTLAGVQEKYEYRLKICSGHFPMSVAVAGQEFVVKNFLGESVPRKMALPQGVEVKVEGAEVVVKSVDKELGGQTAAAIERLCAIKGRDIRIFMDGIWITQKCGKSEAA